MKKRILNIFIASLLVIITLLQFGAWDNNLPADNSLWNNAAGEIRANNDALEVELGVDLNEAHPYFQAAAPTKKPDTTTALDVDDLGRLWTDSDDNVIYVLTAFAGPTWTSTASASDISTSDPTFTLTNTDVEDSDGGRQSQFIGKGTQSGSELTTLGLTEFSHDGTSDDEKGKWRVVLNSGSEGNSPTNVPIEYTADGKIKVANSLSVLDEDTLSSDDDKVVPTQQSVKAYADTKSTIAFPETTVFNTTLASADTFQDLDLSATVGSNSALVFLEITATTFSDRYAVKQKGTGSGTAAGVHYGASTPWGAASFTGEGNTTIVNLVTTTDSSGIIQHACSSNTETITIVMRSFIK
ncbi:hypothetical protein LCGC14_0944510 [marine sediment metagenome]|uniref:Uncharacterized protein n=1 Tax=marine sediment metagenome TaxID=412755 RepID=A0A0F9NJ36_9ZZZZ